MRCDSDGGARLLTKQQSQVKLTNQLTQLTTVLPRYGPFASAWLLRGLFTLDAIVDDYDDELEACQPALEKV